MNPVPADNPSEAAGGRHEQEASDRSDGLGSLQGGLGSRHGVSRNHRL